MNKRFFITIFTLLAVLIGAGVAVFLAKGYTFSPKDESIVGTGIISVNSTPEGAAVYIDGHLTTATNSTIPSLPPKRYHIKISKEGLIPWEKDIDVKQGLVTDIKATLFPSIPTIYPLTYNGITNVTLSPDGQQLAFTVPLIGDGSLKEKGGVWIWSMTSQPISFSRSAEPHQILASTQTIDFSHAKLSWSPDSKQVLVTFDDPSNRVIGIRNYLLSIDQPNSIDNLRDITPTLSSTLSIWVDDKKTKDNTRIISLTSTDLRQIATNSAYLQWSPDESMFLAAGHRSTGQSQINTATKSADIKSLGKFRIYVLASKGDLQSQFKQYDLPDAQYYSWLPDSKHIILVSDNKISICDIDGSNEAIVFAGSFDPLTVFPWPDSSRLVLVSSVPTPTASKPNLFGINLK